MREINIKFRLEQVFFLPASEELLETLQTISLIDKTWKTNSVNYMLGYEIGTCFFFFFFCCIKCDPAGLKLAKCARKLSANTSCIQIESLLQTDKIYKFLESYFILFYMASIVLGSKDVVTYMLQKIILEHWISWYLTRIKSADIARVVCRAIFSPLGANKDISVAQLG